MQTFIDSKRFPFDKSNEMMYVESMSDSRNSADKILS
jgi:hypothetical protein